MNNRVNWLMVGLLLHLYAEVAIWLPLVTDRHLGLYPWAAAIVWCVSALWVLIAIWKVYCYGREVEGWLKHADSRNDYLLGELHNYRHKAFELEKEIVETRHSFDRDNEQMWLTVLDGLHTESVPTLPDEDYPHWVSEDDEYGEEE